MNSQKTMAPRAAKKRNPWLIRGVLAALIVLVAGGGAAWYFLGAKTTTTQSTTQATSYTSTVTRSDLRVTASGSGSLIASNSVDLSFSTSGTVAELKVNLGDTVKSGQVLASLGNAEDLQAAVASQELALLQAQQALATLQQKGGVALAQAYQDMLTAQDNYATANQTNTRVASGATRCSSAVTAKYKSALDSATLRLNNIHAETVVSDAYISAKSAYDTAEANYIYCAGYTDNEKTSEKAALDVAKNTMDQAVNTYNTLKDASGIDPNTLALDTAKVKQTQTNLDNAQKNLDGIVLKAPMDGKVVYLAAN
ncbi:MAG TPA: biotin/lipoyl-binding protein, partial [Anaerolineaceae bacterium]